MKKLLLVLSFIGMLSTLVAAPALSRVITFTQPDGSVFEGVLMGDSSLHWIESNGEIVIFNPADNFYYKAKVDVNNQLIPTQEKPQTLGMRSRSLSAPNKASHFVSEKSKQALQKAYKKTQEGNHPK